MHNRDKKHRGLPLMLLVLSLLLAVVAAGCGSNNVQQEASTNNTADADTNASAPANNNAVNNTAINAGAADNKEQPATRSYTDGLGRVVEIPAAPARVIVSEFSSEALTVGITPIGVGTNDLRNVYNKERLSGIADIGDPPNVEKILELNPDLMIFSQYMPDIYPTEMEQLEKIAPVVYIKFEDPIYDVLPAVSEALGKQDAAAAWTKEYEAEQAAASAKVKAAVGDETVSIFRIEKGRLRIYLSTNYGGYVLRTALGANAPAAVKAEIDKAPWTNAVEISLEKLPEFAGDRMLLVVEGEGEDQDEYKLIQNSALWKGLDAVKNGQVYYLDTDKYYNPDIITVRNTMNEMAEMLSAPPQ